MNQWDRLEGLIGKENCQELKRATVLVLGLGGVGSFAVEHLVRNGIGRLILVDYDIIDITNLNRQVMTLHSNIGKKKVDILNQRIKDINPEIEVILIDQKITLENIDILFANKVNYIIDACDTMLVKKELIKKCIQKRIAFISCMGTGNKLDPRKLKIMDIRKTSYDPVAKTIRKWIRDEKIKAKVPVIASEEPPLKRGKTITSNSFVPSTAGMLAAYYVIDHLVKKVRD